MTKVGFKTKEYLKYAIFSFLIASLILILTFILLFILLPNEAKNETFLILFGLLVVLVIFIIRLIYYLVLPTKIIQADERELILYPKTKKEQIILFQDILNISRAKFFVTLFFTKEMFTIVLKNNKIIRVPFFKDEVELLAYCKKAHFEANFKIKK
ncbi:MAG TPA: hypothetical protein PL120_01755 [Bacilli bacterium]|nr:hypothetical protein [Bacilli bacterium]HPK86091.1 hypothetical protein [Bacilli bacterium]